MSGSRSSHGSWRCWTSRGTATLGGGDDKRPRSLYQACPDQITGCRPVARVRSLPACLLAACGPDYSPNTYASTAAQHANQVDRGLVVGVRKVAISAQGTTGAVTGAATGGVAGSQAPGGTIGSAFGAVGGALIGGIVGTASEHTVSDMDACEYVISQSHQR